MRDWFRVEAAAKGKGGGEILIYSHIGKMWSEDTDAVDAKAFVEALDGLVKAGPGDIHIRINSPGGDVGAGMAIYNALRAQKARVYTTIEGYAYSMASVIALAGRETRMADVGQFMVHNPTTFAWGGQKEMEQAIARLKTARATLLKAYTKKTGKSAEEVEALMDETTFMTAEEAKDFGFVDVIVDGGEVAEGQVAACFDASDWAAFYRGEGPRPVESEGGSPEGGVWRGELAPGVFCELDDAGILPAADGSGAGLDTGGGGAAVTGAESPKEYRMKASEIKDLCPGASADFILAQVEASDKSESYGAVDVLKAWSAEQAKALEAANTAKAEAEKAAAEATAKAAKPEAPKSGLGVSALADAGGAEDGEAVDPIAAFEDAVDGLMKKRGISKQRATGQIIDEQPAMHAAYLDAWNERHGVNRRAM